ncbi:MAG: biopolymer transporter ExbD [Betaproteobacteria bacterium]|nr:biopolymer transporter ExbD [Betaproteobacteria bacterium]
MKFQRGHSREEPEINLVPMIDVLLVIIIFLMLTTTYSKFSGLEINLPTAEASKQNEQPNEIDVAVTASGQVLIDKSPLAATDVGTIAEALRRAAGDRQDPLIVINADAKATHQSVIDVMQAAQSAGFPHISFATQQTPR